MHSPRDRSADAERAEGDVGQLFYGRSAKCRRGRIAAGLLLGDAGRGWVVERLARARASVIAGGEVEEGGELPRSAFDRGRIFPPPRNFFRISSPAPLCEPLTMARALQFGGGFPPYVRAYIDERPRDGGRCMLRALALARRRRNRARARSRAV